MGHIGVKGLKRAVNGLTFDDSELPSCMVCAQANIKHTPFPKKAQHHATNLLHHIHCDICGPLPHYYGGFSHYILFIDDYSHYILLFFMKNCNDALNLFIEFHTAAENFCSKRVTILYVDNMPELIHSKMEQYCKTEGISYEK